MFGLYVRTVHIHRRRRMGIKKEICNNDEFDETRDANGSGTHSTFEPAIRQ